MKTYGLEGKSGTGKSFQAIALCKEKGFDAMIDDGLFIYENRIAAGKSAKREATKIGAIKTALFIQDAHKEEVAEEIKRLSPEAVLVIGTSEEMVHRICERLELPKVSGMIHIEEITSEEERETAAKQRKEFGKHVIPVPTFQLKRQFSGYFLDPMRMLKNLGGGKGSLMEKTVVRPTYSYLGEYSISDKVISDIAQYVGKEMQGISQVYKVTAENTKEGLNIGLCMHMNYNTHLVETAREAQSRIEKMIEKMTAFNVTTVNIEIRGLKN